MLYFFISVVNDLVLCFGIWFVPLLHTRITLGVPQQIILDIWRFQVSQFHFCVMNVVFIYCRILDSFKLSLILKKIKILLK